MPAMAPNKINVDLLREDVRDAVRALAGRLARDLGDNLVSLCVVGSVLTADFHPRRSDINTLLVVEQGSPDLLKTLAGYGEELGRRRLRAPWLMTREFLQRSTDVFGVEFLDFQLNHATVYGPDLLATIAFNKECVRLQCERELRTAEIQLWQGYVRGLGDPKAVEPLLEACAGKLLPVLRAMLWLAGLERPREIRTTLEAAGHRFGFDERMIAALLNLKGKGDRRGADIVDLLFKDTHRVVEHLCRQADQLKTES